MIKRKPYILMYKNCDIIAATNSAIINDLNDNLKIPRTKCVLTYNPISSKKLQLNVDKIEIRRKLGLSLDVKLVVYTGKTAAGLKEIEYLIRTAEILKDYKFLLTGGKPEAVKILKNLLSQRNISNVILTGFLHKYDDVKYYQYAADVLVSYYSQRDHLVKYNLPAKITEYMSTKNPIVTCDYPAVRDLLNKDNALFVEPENPEALAEGIKKLMEDRELARRLAENAYNAVKEITFEKIAKRILEFADRLK